MMYNYESQINFPPREGNNFGQETGDRYGDLSKTLLISISHPRGVMNGGYLTGEFEAYLTDLQGNVIEGFIDEGGVNNSFFRLRTFFSNAEVDKIDEYGTYYNLYKKGNYNKPKVATMFGMLDSEADWFELKSDGTTPRDGELLRNLPAENFLINRKADRPIYSKVPGTVEKAGDILSGTNTLFRSLKVGDMVEFREPVTGRVLLQDVITSIVSDIVALTTGTVAAPLGSEMFLVLDPPQSFEKRSIRSLVVNSTNKFRFTVPLESDYINDTEIPLFLLPSALSIELRLNNADKVIVSRINNVGDGQFLVGYRLKNINFKANIAIPAPDYVDRLVQDYKSGNLGTKVSSVASYPELIEVNSPGGTVEFNTFESEATGVCSILTPRGSNINTKNQSLFVKSGMISYRYRSGLIFYPDDGAVEVDDYAGAEAYEQFRRVMGMSDNSLDQREWTDGLFVDPLYNNCETISFASKFAFSIPLYDYNYKYADLSTDRLLLTFRKATVNLLGTPFGTPQRVIAFVKHNVFVSYSAASGVRVMK